MNSVFDYYTTAQTPLDCARWIAFIRLFSYVRTPACIYTKISMPSSKQIWRNAYVVPIPEYISNILVEFINEISAREAASGLEKLAVSDESMLRDLYIESGVLPYMDYNSSFKPRRLEPYGISASTVVRLGDWCVERCAESVGCGVEVMQKLVAEAVTQLGRLDMEPGALWPDEEHWLLRAGGQWERGVIWEVL